MNPATRRVMHSAQRGDWETPPELFTELQAEFAFTVDAAANGANHLVPTWYGPGGVRPDALTNGPPWEGRIFCNPPYGREINRWCVQAAAARGPVVAMLLPARTDTVWFHALVVPTAEIRFLRGRLRFRLAGQPLDPAPFPSMIAIWRHPRGRYAGGRLGG